MGSKTPSTAAASQLAHLSTKTFFESDRARVNFFKQLNEAMTTGGVGARIPIIQRAVEAQSAAEGQSQTLGREKTARAGLSGSPFDVASQLGQQTEASSRIAAVGPTMAANMFQGAGGEVTSATGIPGLAEAAGIKQGAANQAASTQGQEVAAGGAATGAIAAALIAALA